MSLQKPWYTQLSVIFSLKSIHINSKSHLKILHIYSKETALSADMSLPKCRFQFNYAPLASYRFPPSLVIPL